MVTNSTLCQWSFTTFSIVCHNDTVLPFSFISKLIYLILNILITNGSCYLVYQVFCRYTAKSINSSTNAVYTYPPVKQHVRPPASDNLTKSMASINHWISKTKSRKLHTVIPEYPTQSDQKKFSRLVLIELFVSFRRTRLQKLLLLALSKFDTVSMNRVNSISTLFLLALGVEPTEPHLKCSLQKIVSAGLLYTTHEYVSQYLFLSMAPFDETEKKLMQKIGYDEKKYMFPAEKKSFTSIERTKFLNKNIFMTHPCNKRTDNDPQALSKRSERILKELGEMSNKKLVEKILELDKGLSVTETSIQQLQKILSLSIDDLKNCRYDKFFEVTGEPGNEEHDVLKAIVTIRKIHIQLLSRVEKIRPRKEDKDWYNAIFDANTQGFSFQYLSKRINETRVRYEELLSTSFVFQERLHEHEEMCAYWIFGGLARRIPGKIKKMDPWSYI
ncbi:hypothetical protein BDF21DRAFT_394346 [Thamnidium elegans]|nr:hypothetical protein BDF21DRAFT_394346 [Thamnidium elegans]